MALTLDALSGQLGRSVYEHVNDQLGDLEIPLGSGAVSQGDVRIRPLASTGAVSVRSGASWVDVPTAGLVLVAGQHDHVLAPGEGLVRWTPDVADRERLAVGVVDVLGGSAYVWHAEHGGVGLAPGRYVVRRQREMAQEQRLVAD